MPGRQPKLYNPIPSQLGALCLKQGCHSQKSEVSESLGGRRGGRFWNICIFLKVEKPHAVALKDCTVLPTGLIAIIGFSVTRALSSFLQRFKNASVKNYQPWQPFCSMQPFVRNHFPPHLPTVIVKPLTVFSHWLRRQDKTAIGHLFQMSTERRAQIVKVE